MARFNHIKNSFLAGELSPKVDGRTDLPQYVHGCKTLENMLVLPQGGVTRRPGTRFIQNVTGSPNLFGSRLIPFIYSQNEAYVVEFACTDAVAPGTIRVHQQSGTFTATPTLCASTVTYTKDQLPDIQYAQSADALYLVHPSVPPQKIVRIASNTFELRRWDFYNSTTYHSADARAFRDVNVDTTLTITPSALTGSVTLTASSALFDPNHVDAYFKISHTGLTGAVVITSVTSPTVAIATTVPGADLHGTTATSDWEEGSWSNYRGWPRTVCFWQSRLFFGGNQSQPDTFWTSRLNNYYYFMARRFEQDSTAASSSDPVSLTISSQQVNQIQWMNAGKTMSIGTTGAEYIVQGPDPSKAFGADNFGVSQESNWGSANVQATRSGYYAMFVQRTSRTVREISYDYYSTQYLANNLSIYSDHLPGKNTGFPAKISKIDYQGSRQILWALDSSGGLFGMTRDKQQQIAAWHNYIPGGRPAGTAPFPVIQSICVVPSIDRLNDELWMIVHRSVNGSDVYMIEAMGADFEDPTLYQEDPIFGLGFSNCFMTDCYTTQTFFSTRTTFTGLSAYANETVSILADGFALPNQTMPVDGTLVLTVPAKCVVVGFPYTSKIVTSRIEAGSLIGSAQAQIKRIDHASIRFYRTVGAKFGPSASQLEEINFVPANQPMNTAPPLFTGDKNLEFTSDYDRDSTVTIIQDQPLPMTVLSLVLRGVTNDL